MSSSLTVRRIAADQGATLRELRTAALRDAPDAFDETLEEALSEQAETFDAAAERHATSEVSASFILYTEGHPAGLVGAYFDDTPERKAFVCALWVAPAVRHLRGGELLVNTAGSWLAERGAHEIYAWVADANRNAMRFYEALGFGPTGEHQPIARAPQEGQSLLVRHVKHP
ncbi:MULTISPECIES: GNAT family N-acetyltransferase [unclassified Trinickia]|jgi:ribosomal protein S18 acetylase RimI-like enzyme|uniref:GNAT family N-acetyltransferase n=1 Tax=unclassified Trinickia TaxID=2638168 RepID=UPI00240728F4|nr:MULTISPECIES: GNAT family N-acetyltransferase [unclassified Trinickia]MDG0026608.1 GNAT family N-acetyltransferase [Trinickia sp. Y13]HVW50847.1 GNAT family N-acetyltransferase [Trinickia sp.]